MDKRRFNEGKAIMSKMAEASCPARFSDPEIKGMIAAFKALHSTHQQNFFRTLLWIIKEAQNVPTDDRNAASVKLAKRIMEMVQEENHYLPYI